MIDMHELINRPGYGVAQQVLRDAGLQTYDPVAELVKSANDILKSVASIQESVLDMMFHVEALEAE